MSDIDYRDMYNSERAKNATLKEASGKAIDKIKDFKTNFGIREKSDGTIIIDYDKFVTNLGPEGCLELRKIIDETYSIKGKAGEKPRMKVVQ